MNRYHRKQKQIYYIRVRRKSSKEEQYRQFHSLDSQLTNFQNWEMMSGAVCLGDFVLTCSADKGANFETKEFKEVWKVAKKLRNKLTHVLWTKVDRYSRAVLHGVKWEQDFKNLGLEVNFINEWLDWEDPYAMRDFCNKLSSAEAEVKKLSIRTSNGKSDLREIGYYNDSLPGGWAYEETRRHDGRKYAYKVEPNFTAYKLATEMFYTGTSQAYAIRAAKKETGYNIPSSTLSRFLLSPLPYGFVPIWNRYDIPIPQRVMIDMKPCANVPKMFDTLTMYYAIRDRILSEEKNGLGKDREPFNPQFPLTVSCPSCLKKMRGYNANPSRKTPTPYYDCKSCGKETRINRNKLDRLIAEMLNSIEIHPSIASLMKKGVGNGIQKKGLSQAKKKEQSQKALNQARERLQHLEDNLHRYDPDVYNNSYRKVKGQIMRFESELQLLSQEKKEGLDLQAKIIKNIENIGDWYLKGTPTQKLKLMNAFFPEGFTVSRDGVRTFQVNQILASICSFPESYVYKKKKADQNSLLFHRADVSGREVERYKADIVLLRDFFSTFKKVA